MPKPSSRDPIRLMLVDDHAVVRGGCRRLLEQHRGLAIELEFADGVEALEAFDGGAAAHIDIVVLDLAMPRCSGMDLLREIGTRWPAVRVLVFSMHDSLPVVAQALRLGAAGYVTKASDPEELVRCIDRVVESGGPVLSSDLARVQVLGTSRPDVLNEREIEIVRLLACGDSIATIANKLHLSPKTVSNYQTLLRQKLGLGTAIELLRYALDRGLVA